MIWVAKDVFFLSSTRVGVGNGTQECLWSMRKTLGSIPSTTVKPAILQSKHLNTLEAKAGGLDIQGHSWKLSHSTWDLASKRKK